ncbi:hypothetical protein [Martelella alba]|uniref:Uncharacterized protein n=1 Tax=Martelella alba TaxID=2590451 RepID=A0ABY2SE19_9HYPH|nr:hypothetical protein [Martelella alba]TKI02516.1 hypothetical protein FCN80_24730 [Martelella alba]
MNIDKINFDNIFFEFHSFMNRYNRNSLPGNGSGKSVHPDFADWKDAGTKHAVWQNSQQNATIAMCNVLQDLQHGALLDNAF